MVKVSVIIPVYNVEKFIIRCVESVINQTYENIEIIIVDDGSTDNCPKLCDESAVQDNRIKVIHKENGGLTSARIAGLNSAVGEFILFVDSDDYIEKNMIELMVDEIEKNYCDLVMCSYFLDNKDGIKPISLNINGSFDEQSKIVSSYIETILSCVRGKIKLPGFMWVRLFKREFIEDSFFVSEREYFTEDDIFNIKYALKCNKISIIDVPLYHYCFNENSLSNSYRKNKFDMLIHRADYICDYLKRQRLSVSNDRIIMMYLSALFLGIDNEVLLGNKESFRKKVITMMEYSSIKKHFKLSNLKYMSNSSILSFLLLKLRFYNLLFEIRSNRLRNK